LARLVRDLRRGVELRVHRRARVGQLAAELESRLLAVQQLRDRIGELVDRGTLAGLLVRAHERQDGRQDQDVLARQEPLVERERRRPVDVVLGVPLPALAALVERAQLLDLVAVVPGPVQIDRHVDVELGAQGGDACLVDLHDLEVTDLLPVLREDLVHGCSLA
jgi:hypothetical protein